MSTRVDTHSWSRADLSAMEIQPRLTDLVELGHMDREVVLKPEAALLADGATDPPAGLGVASNDAVRITVNHREGHVRLGIH
jgi:hypothetical protein